MITYRNLLLVFLMIVALPVTGMAHIMAPVTHQAMTQMTEAAGIGAPDRVTAPHDCDAQARSVCDNGQECKTSSLLQLALSKVAVPALSPRPAVVSLPTQVLTRAPDIVWHPPRS